MPQLFRINHNDNGVPGYQPQLSRINKSFICDKCKNRIMITNQFAVKTEIKPYKEYICQDCFEKYVMGCQICCTDFFKKNLIKCSLTGSIKKDKYICPKCYNANFIKCSNCNQIYFIQELKNGANGLRYCAFCWHDRFNHCDRCNNPFWKDDLRYEEGSGSYFCAACWIKVNLIHDYSYNPLPSFSKCSHEPLKTLFMGIELELEHKHSAEKMAKKFLDFLTSINMKNYFYLKYDSSVNGFEIVSHPFTLQYIKEYMQMNKILIYLADNKFSANEKCGLHIHMDKRFFSLDDIRKIRIFISKYKKQIFPLTYRTCTDNQFCIYENYDVPFILNNNNLSGRHWAFNPNTSKKTVELRMFNATLDINNFFSALEFSSALGCFIKTIPLKVFSYVHNATNIKFLNIWKLFCIFVNKKEKYENLLNLLKKEKVYVSDNR